jgi:GTP diphosphokinase / guanosine-3',5'-bis(diphosphate) 3'-diphosphatase
MLSGGVSTANNRRAYGVNTGGKLRRVELNDIVLVTRAVHFAAVAHAGQKRKGSLGEPYVNHLADVAAMVALATGGKDSALVAAAYLHDAIEDQGVKRSVLVREFGRDVADLVSEVTDDKSLPKAVRKRLQVTNAPKKSKRAKILKTADKISNLKALELSPPTNWPLSRRLKYVTWARAVHVGLKGASRVLDRMFEKQADRTDRALSRSR